MTRNLSPDWIEWIDDNLLKKNDKVMMMEKLLDNGFSVSECSERVYGNPLTDFSSDWKNWISENLTKGISKDELHHILVCKGYSDDLVRQELNFQKINHSLWNKLKLVNSNHIHNNLYLIENFLEKDICHELSRQIKVNSIPSTITNKNEKDKYFRTSQTCHLDMSSSIVKKTDGQICNYLSIPTERSENIQGQYYQVGNEFKPHTDWFNPRSREEWKEYGAKLGQRTWTFMIYLNDVEEGGETVFPKYGVKIKPKIGRAVVWLNLLPDGEGDHETLHWGTPVEKGEKLIITKWFRTRGTLDDPFKISLSNQIPNYTQLGYTKTHLSPELFRKINYFYHRNKSKSKIETGYAIGNFVISSDGNPPAYYLPITKEIEEELKGELIHSLERWSNSQLEWTATYGIRTYQRGSFLKMHTDRYETHIISVIINVAQDVDEDWPLVLIDNYGREQDIILKPGEIVYYESARCRHGRPYPLNGNSFSNIFFHTKPIDWDLKIKKNTEWSQYLR